LVKRVAREKFAQPIVEIVWEALDREMSDKRSWYENEHAFWKRLRKLAELSTRTQSELSSDLATRYLYLSAAFAEKVRARLAEDARFEAELAELKRKG